MQSAWESVVSIVMYYVAREEKASENTHATNNQLPTTNSFGFTLVELLVVIIIIAVLSAIGLVIYSGVQANARDVKRKADLTAISRALEQFKAANGVYPKWIAWSNDSSTWETWFGVWLRPSYIAQLPVDPKNGGTCCGVDYYVYAYKPILSGTTAVGYRLCANLENNSDKARNVDYPDITSNPPVNSCSGDGNYWADYKVESQL